MGVGGVEGGALEVDHGDALAAVGEGGGAGDHEVGAAVEFGAAGVVRVLVVAASARRRHVVDGGVGGMAFAEGDAGLGVGGHVGVVVEVGGDLDAHRELGAVAGRELAVGVLAQRARDRRGRRRWQGQREVGGGHQRVSSNGRVVGGVSVEVDLEGDGTIVPFRISVLGEGDGEWHRRHLHSAVGRRHVRRGHSGVLRHDFGLEERQSRGGSPTDRLPGCPTKDGGIARGASIRDPIRKEQVQLGVRHVFNGDGEGAVCVALADGDHGAVVAVGGDGLEGEGEGGQHGESSGEQEQALGMDECKADRAVRHWRLPREMRATPQGTPRQG